MRGGGGVRGTEPRGAAAPAAALGFAEPVAAAARGLPERDAAVAFGFAEPVAAVARGLPERDAAVTFGFARPERAVADFARLGAFAAAAAGAEAFAPAAAGAGAAPARRLSLRTPGRDRGRLPSTPGSSLFSAATPEK
jgi:hypothetical protein